MTILEKFLKLHTPKKATPIVIPKATADVFDIETLLQTLKNPVRRSRKHLEEEESDYSDELEDMLDPETPIAKERQSAGKFRTSAPAVKSKASTESEDEDEYNNFLLFPPKATPIKQTQSKVSETPTVRSKSSQGSQQGEYHLRGTTDPAGKLQRILAEHIG